MTAILLGCAASTQILSAEMESSRAVAGKLGHAAHRLANQMHRGLSLGLSSDSVCRCVTCRASAITHFSQARWTASRKLLMSLNWTDYRDGAREHQRQIFPQRNHAQTIAASPRFESFYAYFDIYSKMMGICLRKKWKHKLEFCFSQSL